MEELFRKKLSSTDACSSLSIPIDDLDHFAGMNDVSVRDWTGNTWNFHLYIRNEGHPKPVFKGEWARFAREKHLQKDDLAIFRLEDGQFTIEVLRETDKQLFGRPLKWIRVDQA